MDKDHWYKKEDGMYIIDLKVDSKDQLFDKKDPNPYRTKDLDDDVVEYIISSCFDIGRSKLGTLRISVMSKITDSDKREIIHAICDYFEYRKQISSKNLRAILSIGLKSFFIGLLFLSFSIYLSNYLSKISSDIFFKSFIKEGFLLLGWVSMWKPINIFLYEWWPIRENIRLFTVLAQVNVSIDESSKDM